MTRVFAPPQSTALATQITESWRGDFTSTGRDDKARGVDKRHELRREYEAAAGETARAEGSGG